MSLDERKHSNYLIRIFESGPQIVDMKKSFFILDNRNSTSRSPRRDKIAYNPSTPETKKNYINKTNSNNTNTPNIISKQEEDIRKLREIFDRKITENIRSRKSFDELLKDPELQIFISEN